MKIRNLLLLVSIVCCTSAFTQKKQVSVISPDGLLEINITLADNINWSVYHNKDLILKDCGIALTVNNKTLGEKPELLTKVENTIDQEIIATIPIKSSVIKDKCNEIELQFKGDFSVIFRAYNDGIAYRFKTSYNKEIIVNSEEMKINLNGSYLSYFPEEESIISHYERSYIKIQTDTLKEKQFCSLPVFFKNKKSILFTESDLADYPGMFIKGAGVNKLEAMFPKYVLEAKPAKEGPDRNEVIVKEADYIAKTNGRREFPWRLFIISGTDTGIVQSNLVYQLAGPSKLTGTDWIKPGKIAWDWWNFNNIYLVDFESGINTNTYKYYIDFASEFGLDYIILDEGWSKSPSNLFECNPEMDVKELIRYGKEKNVGIILWALWKPLEKDMEKILDLYKEWGVKGVKVDFMQRLDQYMVNYYEKVAVEAAKRQFIVDFHGAYKPAGMNRTYPNVLSFEGVKGLEHSKWSRDITPEHDVTLPFIRNVAGPMDYTPGAMNNTSDYNFHISHTRPMSQGTRTHQIALYIVYESALQMLADNPTNYYKEKECAEFIAKIPVTWDETIVLNGEIGEYITIARRKGETWHIGAITNWSDRNLEVDLSFLPEGEYNIEIIQDGINAYKNSEDYKKIYTSLNSDKLNIKMTSGGGYAAVISKK